MSFGWKLWFRFLRSSRIKQDVLGEAPKLGKWVQVLADSEMGFVGFEQWKRRSELVRSGGEGSPEDRSEGETKWVEEEEEEEGN